MRAAFNTVDIAGFAATIVLAAIVLPMVALNRSVWIDEFWTLWAIAPAGSGQDLVRRWLSDVHPILHAGWAWLIGDAAGDDIGLRRLATNGPAALMLFGGVLSLWRAVPQNGTFYWLFLAALFGAPDVVLSFGEYRLYFAHVCAVALLLAFWFHVLSLGTDYDPGRNRPALFIGVISILLSIALHFIATLIASLAVLGMLVNFYRARQRGWALRCAAAAVAAWAFVLVSLAVQAPLWRGFMDVTWIGTSPADAALMYTRLLGDALFLSPATLLIAAVLWSARRSGGQSDDPKARGFAALALLTVLASGAVLFVLNWAHPMLMPRYLVLWIPLICAALAALAAPVLRSPSASTIMVVVLALSAFRISGEVARLPGWEAGTRKVAAHVRRCPETRVYWLSPWRLTPARDARVAMRETEALRIGYERQARSAGFEVREVPASGVIQAPAGRCPVLIWVEHGLGRLPDSAPAFFEQAGLRLSQSDPRPRLRLQKDGGSMIVGIEPVAR